MDSNARLTYLNSRNTDNLIQKIIDSTLDSYITKKTESKFKLNPDLLKERQRAIKNALFLKYCGIEYEGLFQLYFTDRKVD